jgi:hypothetical protein
MEKHAVFYYLGRLCFVLGGFGIGGYTIGSIFTSLFTRYLPQQVGATAADWLTGLGGLGVGGVIAGIVITWKRQDDIAHTRQLVELGANNAKLLSETGQDHSRQMEAMFTRLEAMSTRVLTAFETNTKTVEQMAINSSRDQAERHAEHERMDKKIDDLDKSVQDQARMTSQGISADRRRSGGHPADRG